jgi:hypothetical protein
MSAFSEVMTMVAQLGGDVDPVIAATAALEAMDTIQTQRELDNNSAFVFIKPHAVTEVKS